MPYVNNPYYGNYYQPSYAPQYQQTGIAGRVVNNFSEVVPNDVPMNGTYAIFVKGDMSEIQAKAWSADGKIVTNVFKPTFGIVANNSIPNEEKSILGASEDVTEAFMKRFDEIQSRLDAIEDIFSKQSTPRRKKESDTE